MYQTVFFGRPLGSGLGGLPWISDPDRRFRTSGSGGILGAASIYYSLR